MHLKMAMYGLGSELFRDGAGCNRVLDLLLGRRALTCIRTCFVEKQRVLDAPLAAFRQRPLGRCRSDALPSSWIFSLRYVESFHPRRLPARRSHSLAPRAIDYDDRHDRPDDDSRGSPENPPNLLRRLLGNFDLKFFFQICSYIDSISNINHHFLARGPLKFLKIASGRSKSRGALT